MVIPPKKRQQFKCAVCSAETGSVRFRCAEILPKVVNPIIPTNGDPIDDPLVDKATCPDFDLCVPCFLAGKTLGPHRAHHAYRIISSHAFPIFCRDWGADEELLLIEAAEMYGLGNWEDIAEYVGARTREECEEHYAQIYIKSDQYPLPSNNIQLDIDPDTFQAHKKRRLEELQQKPLVPPPPKPMASAPTCHDVAGFMPGRLEYETEYENDAETLVKDMEFGKVYQFGGDEQPAADDAPIVEVVKVEGEEAGLPTPPTPDEPEGDLVLKLAILEMFNERYDRRMAAKEIIFDRGLMNYRTIFANERKRSKEERDLVNRTKVFARIQTAQDHESFVDGLLYEAALRKRIADLQEYRRVGITTLAESEKYERDKAQRATLKRSTVGSFADTLNFSSAGPSRAPSVGGANRPLSSTTTLDRRPNSSALLPRPTTSSLTLATAQSLHLLTTLEQQLCATLRILPRPYLFLKEVLMREWVRLGGRMSNEEARGVVSRRTEGGGGDNGVNGEWGEKIERVWEFLVEAGGLRSFDKNSNNNNNNNDDQDDEDDRGMVMGIDADVHASGSRNESDRNGSSSLLT